LLIAKKGQIFGKEILLAISIQLKASVFGFLSLADG
jgi:hypothetical protein